MNYPSGKITEYATCHGGDLIFGDPYGRMEDLHFHAFIQEMSQTFSLTYDSEEVYGRNDPIMSYRNTKRSMSLSWNVPSVDLYDAKYNRFMTRLLIRMLYPRYENITNQKVPKKYNPNYPIDPFSVVVKMPKGATDSYLKYFHAKQFLEHKEYEEQNPDKSQIAHWWGKQTTTKHHGYFHTQTMMENPLISIKYANLISAADGKPLMGYLDGLSVKPMLDEGYFTECAGEVLNPITKQKEQVRPGSYPKVYSISCNFNVIHEDPLGWDAMGNPMSDIFQY